MIFDFIMYVYNIKLCLETYTSSTHLLKVPDFVMYVCNTITLFSGSIYSTNTSTNIIMINIHSVEYYFHWQLSQYSYSLEAVPHVVYFLAEARHIFCIQNIRPALVSICPPVQWMLWILPQHWNSCCVRLITQLYFLVTDGCSCNCASPFFFVVYTGTILSLTIVLEEGLQYLHGHHFV